MTTGMTPSLGRIVHFTVDTNAAQKLNQLGGKKYNVGEKVAGIITRPLDNNACNLSLFADGADEVMHLSSVPYSTSNQPGTWTWPERIAEQVAA
jgi:hypothetical protein